MPWDLYWTLSNHFLCFDGDFDSMAFVKFRNDAIIETLNLGASRLREILQYDVL